MKIKMIAIAAAAAVASCFATSAFAQTAITETAVAEPVVQAKATPKKVAILVADVTTIDQMAKTEEYIAQIKQFNLEDKPTLPAGTTTLDPDLAKTDIRIRYNRNWSEYDEARKEVARRNMRMERILEGLRNSVLHPESSNRDLVLGAQMLQAYLSDYSGAIALVDRRGANVTEIEKQIAGNDSMDIAACSLILTVSMQDDKPISVQFDDRGTMRKRTIYTRKAVAALKDFSGNVILSLHVSAKKDTVSSSYVKKEGFDALIKQELIEMLLKDIATKVGNYLTAELKLNAKGPKGDNEFDADDVEFTIDGESVSSGERILRVDLGRGDFKTSRDVVVTATCDGYKTITKKISLKTGNQKKHTFKFKADAAAEKE